VNNDEKNSPGLIIKLSEIFFLTETQFQILVWLSYRIAASFAFGLPLCLLIWSKISKVSCINRLLSIYWKVSILYLIGILFLSGTNQIGYLISLISPILMIFSIWFWIDLNEEIEEMPSLKPISLTTRIWRWTLSLWVILNSGLHIISWKCLNSTNSLYCNTWREVPLNSFITTKTIIKFILGGDWTTTFASFIGYIALTLYIIGMLQWLIVQLPRNGRFARKF
tara:strand:- start:1021 stop:1692 length:672 start_codon:yes stop_codon:yes gene_type:complete